MKVGDTFDELNLIMTKKGINKFLTDQGFLNATVEPHITTDPKGIVIIFNVNLGQRTKITGWQFEGNEYLTDQELNQLLGKRFRRFSRKAITEVMSIIEGFYENSGFPFVEVKLAGLIETPDGIKPVLNIKEGQRVKISFLTFASDCPLNPKLLLRLTRFTHPVYYHPARLNQWRSNLNSTDWIKTDSSDIVSRDSLYGIRFWITPLKTGELSGIIGYSPEDRRFLGWVNISLLNLFNTGRSGKVTFRSHYGETEYQLEYTEPWPFNQPISLTGAVSHRIYDTSYAFTNISITGTVSYEAIKFNLISGFDRLVGKTTKNSIWIGSGFYLDNRNNMSRLTRGTLIRITTRAGKQSTPELGSGLIAWVETNFTSIIPFTEALAVNNSLNLRTIYSEIALTQPELYNVGGWENIRGYREGTFTTDRLGWWNFEPRYYFNFNSRIHLFLDTGIFRNNDGNLTLISGYGLGGRWQTKIGIIGIDFGIPIPESPLQGKIHLNFRTTF